MKHSYTSMLLALSVSVALSSCDFSSETTGTINHDTHSPIISFEADLKSETTVGAKADSPGLLVIENAIEVHRIQYRDLTVGANRLVINESAWHELPFSKNAKDEIVIPLDQFHHFDITEAIFVEFMGLDDKDKQIFQSGSTIR